MGEKNIRKATGKDFAELLDLMMENMKHHIRLSKLSWESLEKIKKEQAKELRKDLDSTKTTILVYENEEKILGYVTLSLLKKSPYLKPKVRGSIDDLFVSQKFRRKGIGRDLINSAISLLKSKGVRDISISVVSRNKDAISAYEKFGFKEDIKKMNLRIR